MMNGQVRIINADGSTYVGRAKDGLREGKGDQLFANRQRYTGEWRADKMEGEGVYSANSTKYEGPFY